MRLLSYNIHKGVGGRDGRYRLDRIIRVIEEEAPDLACLQEVDRNVRRSRFDDQPHQLAVAAGAVAAPYQLNVPRRLGGYGNLLLSRWPIEWADDVSLQFGRRKPRGAQLAVVATPEGPLHLVNWHLGLAEHERRWQARHLLADSRFVAQAGLPTLVVGDANDWRDTLARIVFAHHGYWQVTAPRSRFRSFPAVLPLGALDKAFATGPIQITNARIVRSPVAREASDHLPLVIDFHLHAGSRSQGVGHPAA